jgi:hypothetical protein
VRLVIPVTKHRVPAYLFPDITRPGRQSGPVTDRSFEIEFLDPGVQAYAFTFG